MRIIFLILLYQLFNCILLISNPAISTSPKPITLKPVEGVEINIHNQNEPHVKNEVNVYSEPSDSTNCTNLYGKKFLHCMACQTGADQKENFKKFSVNRAKYYLMSLNIWEYNDFISLFTEEEWQRYWHSLKDKNKHHLPATLQEHKELIIKACLQTHYCLACAPMCYLFGSSSLYGTEKWWEEMEKNKCLSKEYMRRLKETFEELKKEAFKIK